MECEVTIRRFRTTVGQYTSFSMKGCDSLIIHFLWKPKVFTRNEISLSTQYTWKVNNIAIIKAQTRPRTLKKPIMMIIISQNRKWNVVQLLILILCANVSKTTGALAAKQPEKLTWKIQFCWTNNHTCSCTISEKWSTSGTGLILNVHKAKI